MLLVRRFSKSQDNMTGQFPQVTCTSVPHKRLLFASDYIRLFINTCGEPNSARDVIGKLCKNENAGNAISLSRWLYW